MSSGGVKRSCPATFRHACASCGNAFLSFEGPRQHPFGKISDVANSMTARFGGRYIPGKRLELPEPICHSSETPQTTSRIVTTTPHPSTDSSVPRFTFFRYRKNARSRYGDRDASNHFTTPVDNARKGMAPMAKDPLDIGVMVRRDKTGLE